MVKARQRDYRPRSGVSAVDFVITTKVAEFRFVFLVNSGTLSPSTILVINPNTISAGLDGGLVIMGLDPAGLDAADKQEQYYALNDVGARIWQLIQAGLSLAEIKVELLGEYNASAEALWQDIQGLAMDLLQEGLVSVQES
jgi:hypothetical protein